MGRTTSSILLTTSADTDEPCPVSYLTADSVAAIWPPYSLTMAFEIMPSPEIIGK